MREVFTEMFDRPIERALRGTWISDAVPADRASAPACAAPPRRPGPAWPAKNFLPTVRLGRRLRRAHRHCDCWQFVRHRSALSPGLWPDPSHRSPEACPRRPRQARTNHHRTAYPPPHAACFSRRRSASARARQRRRTHLCGAYLAHRSLALALQDAHQIRIRHRRQRVVLHAALVEQSDHRRTGAPCTRCARFPETPGSKSCSRYRERLQQGLGDRADVAGISAVEGRAVLEVELLAADVAASSSAHRATA